MRRASIALPPAAFALAWLAGSAAQLRQPALWDAGAYAALFAAGLTCAALAWRARRSARACVALAVASALALAFAQAGWRAHARLAGALPAALEGADLRVTGVIATLPVHGAAGQRFGFDVESAHTVDGDPLRVPRRIALGWYHDADAAAPELRAGDRWRFVVRLRRPHGARNPHGFDYELRLFEDGVRATGYVRIAHEARRLEAAVAHPLERARQRVRDAIVAQVPDRGAAGVLAALVVGDQAAIERDDWELYRITGIAHLMSISGLHVTMFAWLAGLAAGALWRRSGALVQRLPAPTAALWGGLAAAAGYALFAGWGVPAQRTVWMLATVAVLRTAGLHWPWPPVLLAAAFVVTVADPWALLQPGFWLSFAAVGLLLASEPAQRTASPHAARAADPPWAARGGSIVVSALRTQAVATLGLAPLTLLFFQQVSLVGFAANLLAIPLVTLLVTPLAMLGVVLPPIWHAAAASLAPLQAALGALASWPAATWQAGVAPGWAQAAGLAAGAVAVAPLPWRLRLLAVPLVLPLLAPLPPVPPPGRFDVVAADVGQGTAVIVRTRSHVLLYDSGPQYSRDGDAGQRVLLPLLRARGEPRLQMLVLSHRDTDHVGGAASVLGALPVDELLHSLEDGHPLVAGRRDARRCAAGRRWRWDGVDFELLHPTDDDRVRAPKPNAVSCVLRVSGEGGALLLAGDIELAQESALVARSGDSLASDVLLVPHHGSRTSSSDALLDAVQPRVAIVQAGYRNRFGHPAAPVVERYAARGVELVRSDRCGAWQWRQGEGQMRCERAAEPRYWHHRP